MRTTPNLCKDCLTEKRCGEMTKSLTSPHDHRPSLCRLCNNQRAKTWQAKNPARKREYDKRWQTENCQRRTEYNKRWKRDHPDRVNASRRRRYAANPRPKLESNHRWRLANPDYQRQWRAANPEKGREKHLRRRAQKESRYTVPPGYIKRLLAGSCYYCGERLAAEIDHVVPLSRGGKHSIGNLVGSCLECNRGTGGKHALFVSEWKLKKRKGLVPA